MKCGRNAFIFGERVECAGGEGAGAPISVRAPLWSRQLVWEKRSGPRQQAWRSSISMFTSWRFNRILIARMWIPICGSQWGSFRLPGNCN